MTRVVAAALVVVCASAVVRAHQLDEYLQAARLSLGHDRVTVEIDLTPGVTVAQAIIARLDADGDRIIAPEEARAYAESVLSEVLVTLDGRPVGVMLERVEVPSREELRDGVGTIQLRAGASVAHGGSGRRRLDFRNNHRPDLSVYLVNALTSTDRAVHVVRQTRDVHQRGIQIDYRVDPDPAVQAAWWAGGLAGLALTIVAGRAHGRRQAARHPSAGRVEGRRADHPSMSE